MALWIIFFIFLILLAAIGWVRGMGFCRESRSLRRQLAHSEYQRQFLDNRLHNFSQLQNSLTMELDPQGIIEFLNGWPNRPMLRSALGANFFSYLDPEYAQDIRNQMELTLAGNDCTTMDCSIRTENGGSIAVRILACPRGYNARGQSPGIMAVVEDIRQEIQSRKDFNRKEVMEFTTSRILRSFLKVSAENLEDTIAEALASLKSITTVDHCHLAIMGNDGQSLEWKSQWPAPESVEMGWVRQPGTMSKYAWFREVIHRGELLHLPSLKELPPSAVRERKLLEKLGVQSMLGFPLVQDNKVFGFLLFSTLDRPGNWDHDGIRMLGILADVVGSMMQRRLAKQNLEAANTQLMDIISFLPDPTFVIDADRKVVAWNRAMEDLTGVPERDMLGLGDYAYAVPFYGKPIPVLIDHFGDANLDRHRELYSFVEINRDTLYAEAFVPNLNDGQGAHLWLTASPLYDSQGNVVGAIESLRDVTYRKKSEAALRESELRFRQLIETMNDGLAVFDEFGQINFANPVLCDLLGYSYTEILGRSIGEIFPEMVAGESLANWEGWEIDCGQGVEMSIACKYGRQLPLRISPGHIVDDEGVFGGGMVVVLDLTPLIQAEQKIRALNQDLEQKVIDSTQELRATNNALSSSEERYRRIIESLREGYIFYSQAPNGDFTYVSPSFKSILGYESRDDFARSLDNSLGEKNNRQARASMEQSRLGYRQAPFDLLIKNKGGQNLVLEIQESLVFDSFGKILSIEGFCRDATEERANLKLIRDTQEKLIEAEKMAALGSLVAGVSHEINTPVGIGVTAASHLAQEATDCHRAYKADNLTRTHFESFLESAQETSRLIQGNLHRAADLLQNFKMVATDQTAGQERSFKLREYFEDVLHSLSPKFRNTGFTIQCDCPADLEMNCDPGALYQVITNLVMNSLNHGFDGVLIGEITLSARINKGHLEIVYRDNGIGMNRKDQARAFEPFFTTKRGQGGTGLGLHIVYNQVTQGLGGTISCASKPGKGTQFIISVPLLAEVENG